MKDVSSSDVEQGCLGDCWIMAGLTALANVPEASNRICVAHDTKIGIYGFVFYRDGEWIYSIIDDKLYLKSPCWDSPSLQRELLQQTYAEDNENTYRKTYQTGSKALFFAQFKDQNETWVPLFEKAYAKTHGDYASLHGGWVGEGIEDLSGGVTTELLTSDILDIDDFWVKEMSRVNDEFPFSASTGLLEHSYGERKGISEGHAYAVVEARTLKSGQRLVKLRNPSGKVRRSIWEGAWSDGSKEWTAEVQGEMDHRFGSDSVFWISYEDLVRTYTHFDRTRLFGDRDWRCCQRWIGVDVPRKAAYHETVHIKVTRDTPLVLVLSQLDGRYFKGLQGQYSFRIHFRLHHEDSPNAENYIVRSHGNYLMERSVSVDLPDLPSRNYVVYMKVTATRDSNAQSVEQVVKREAAPRIENEKLAQVGYAYDLAHSKAWDHMDKVTRLRMKKDQKKASACRQKERRRLWEKHATNRKVSKRQTKKNLEKRKRRRAEWDTEQTRLDEEFNAKARAEKAVGAEKGAPEADDEALSKKTEAIKLSVNDKDETVVVDDRKVDDGVISCSTGSPRFTPKSVESTADAAQEMQQANPAAAAEEYDSEEEEMHEPWNAICIVGVRVYSKDEHLRIWTVVEDGELLEAVGSNPADLTYSEPF